MESQEHFDPEVLPLQYEDRRSASGQIWLLYLLRPTTLLLGTTLFFLFALVHVFV